MCSRCLCPRLALDRGDDAAGEGGASTNATVPFSGNGVYTVTVSAWGYDEREPPPPEVEPECEQQKPVPESVP